MGLQNFFMHRVMAVLALVFMGYGCTAQQVKRININELQAYIQKSEKPLVVNFWATFCKPCMEEIPYFQHTIRSQYKGEIELLLVSLDVRADYPQKISSIAAQKNISAHIAWLNETDADYFCPKIDQKWLGAIPCTLMVNNKKKYRKFYDDQLSPVQLDKELKALVQ